MLRVTLRGLVAHKLRFLLTAIAVVLGVAFVSGTLVFTDTLRKTFDDLFASVYEGTDAYVRNRNAVESDFGPAQRERIPANLVAEVRAVEGVAVADAEVQLQKAQFLDKAGKGIGNPSQGQPTFGFNWSTVPRLNPYTLVRYRGDPSRPPTAANQVVMDKGSADEGKFAIGETVDIVFGGSTAQDSFTIVGVATFGSSDRPASATVALFTLAEVQRLNGTTELNGISAAAEPGISESELVTRIRSQVRGNDVQVMTGAKLITETQNQVQKGLGFFTTALLIFALVSLFVGAFIIVNTFSIVIAQRTRELALLRALGASGRQVRVSVLGEAFLVGVVASAVGIVLGLALALGLRAAMRASGFEIPSTALVFKPATAVICMALGVVVTFLSAVLPARRAARIPPMAALRATAAEQRHLGVRSAIGAAITTAGAGIMGFGLFGSAGVPAVGIGAVLLFLGVAVLGPVISRPVSRALGAPLPRWRGMPGQLARENAVRNPRRTASTAAALMIGVALLGLITIFASSLKQSISGQIDSAFRGDLIVMNEGGGFIGFSPTVAREVRAVPGVQSATPMRFGPFEAAGSGQFLFASPPKLLVKAFDLDPRAGDLGALGPDQIAVSQRVLGDHHWKLGDRIRTKFPVGGNRRMEIGAVFGVGQREGLSDYVISLQAFDRRFTEKADNQVLLNLEPGTTVNQVSPAIRQVLKGFPGTVLNDRDGLKEQVQGQINQLVGMIFALLFLALLIALIGIMNTLLLSIVERTREVGLLRAVGMTRRQIRTMVRWESIIVAVFGALLGLVIGVGFGWAIVRALRDQGFTDFLVPGGQLAAIVIAAALAGVLAAAYPARRASRFDVLEAISTE